jgi:c-di-GMP-binding flagellar brake protein YcgR
MNTEHLSEASSAGQRLSIDIGAEVQLEMDGISERLRCHVIGMRPGEYLIITIPEVRIPGGITYKFAAGRSLLVRYMHQGTVFGFETIVLGTTTHPARLVFLRYPRIIQEHNIRQQPRVECLLPSKISLSEKKPGDKKPAEKTASTPSANEKTAGGKTIEGNVLDLSESGCRFRLKNATLQAEKIVLDNTDPAVTLNLQLPGVPGELTLPGLLRNRKEDSDKTEIGISFQEINPADKEKLVSYLKNAE